MILFFLIEIFSDNQLPCTPWSCRGPWCAIAGAPLSRGRSSGVRNFYTPAQIRVEGWLALDSPSKTRKAYIRYSSIYLNWRTRSLFLGKNNWARWTGKVYMYILASISRPHKRDWRTALSLNQGGGIRGDIIVPARRLELKHDATEVELTSTVRFL